MIYKVIYRDVTHVPQSFRFQSVDVLMVGTVADT